MATLPSASVRVSSTAGTPASGSDTICIIAPVPVAADAMPRRYGSAQAIYDKHAYSEGVEYASFHAKFVKKPMIFIGVPIAAPGEISRIDDTGNTGTCVVTSTAGSDGVLSEHDGVLTVVSGGTIGSDQIRLSLSLDNGRSAKVIRLGTDNVYIIPYVGVTLNFGAGDLNDGDVIYMWHGSGPTSDADGWADAFTNLRAQLGQFRSVILIGDLADSTESQAFLDELTGYRTEGERLIYGRASLPDRLPLASFSTTVAVTAAASGKTFTRPSGSWIKDGFAIGTTFDLDGSVSNDGAFTVTAITALVLTVTETVVDETIPAHTARFTGTGPLKADWMAELDAEHEAVRGGEDGFRLDMSAGRGSKSSPFSVWNFRRPAGWFASIREYQHDLHIPTWRKKDGNLGVDLFDSEKNLVEWDDRVDGEAGVAAGFTVMRTWPNGPGGAFIGLSMTRGEDGSLLSLTHNVAVVNELCTVCQRQTENAIGESLVLDEEGHATTDSLNTIQTYVNAALELAGLKNRGEGQRCSKVVWTPSSDDVLNVAEALLTGVLEIELNGTIHSVETFAHVRTGG